MDPQAWYHRGIQEEVLFVNIALFFSCVGCVGIVPDPFLPILM
jgi:hypothetical protein